MMSPCLCQNLTFFYNNNYFIILYRVFYSNVISLITKIYNIIFNNILKILNKSKIYSSFLKMNITLVIIFPFCVIKYYFLTNFKIVDIN